MIWSVIHSSLARTSLAVRLAGDPVAVSFSIGVGVGADWEDEQRNREARQMRSYTWLRSGVRIATRNSST